MATYLQSNSSPGDKGSARSRAASPGPHRGQEARQIRDKWLVPARASAAIACVWGCGGCVCVGVCVVRACSQALGCRGTAPTQAKPQPTLLSNRTPFWLHLFLLLFQNLLFVLFFQTESKQHNLQQDVYGGGVQRHVRASPPGTTFLLFHCPSTHHQDHQCPPLRSCPQPKRQGHRACLGSSEPRWE